MSITVDAIPSIGNDYGQLGRVLIVVIQSLCLIALVGGKQHSTSTPMLTLGKERAAFGVHNTGSQAGDFRDMMGDHASEMWFPVGKANERFLINTYEDHWKGELINRMSLVFEVKTGKRIRRQWFVDIGLREWDKGAFDGLTIINDPKGVKRSRIPQSPLGKLPKEGTLTLMLKNRGLRVRGKIPKAVLSKLREVSGYAGYQKPFTISSDIFYWYMRPDGVITTQRQSDRFEGETGQFPLGQSPFPISPEEERAVNSAVRGGKTANLPKK